MIGRDEPDRGGAAEPGHPDEPHAGEEEQRAPDQRDQHGLPEIGLQHEPGYRERQQRQRHGVGGHFRAAGGFGEQPGDQDHECGLEKLRRLDVDAEQDDPAPRALDLGAELQRGGDQQQAQHEDDERKPADMARRQTRGREHHGERRDEVEHVPVHEIERLEAEPGGDRRAGGQREHDPAQHEREQRCQQQAVDRPPPGSKGRTLKTRDHRDPPQTDADARRSRARPWLREG